MLKFAGSNFLKKRNARVPARVSLDFVGTLLLLLIPYPQSRNQVREVRFPGDSEIVGRVTAVSMRIAE